MVSKEENLQADMAAPQVTQVALYRLRNNEEGAQEECLDACVKRGAICNTDHSMVRAKLVVGQSARSFRRASGRAGVKRWNVQGDCEDDRGIVTAKGRFSGGCNERAKREMGHRQKCRREMGCFEYSDV